IRQVGLHRGKCVELGAGQRIARSIAAAGGEQQAILLHRAACGSAARGDVRAGGGQRPLPCREKFRGCDRLAAGGSANDQNIVVIGQQESEMSLARRGSASLIPKLLMWKVVSGGVSCKCLDC